jgi:hypothetical protein
MVDCRRRAINSGVLAKLLLLLLLLCDQPNAVQTAKSDGGC